MSDSSDDEIVVKIKAEDVDDCIVVACATDKRKRVLSIASDLTPSSSTSTPTRRPKRHRKAHAASSSTTPATTLAVGVPERSSEGRRPYTVLSIPQAPTSNEDGDNGTSCASCTEATPTQPAKLCRHHHQAHLERKYRSPASITSSVAARDPPQQQVAPDPKLDTTAAGPKANSTQLVPAGDASSPPQQIEQPRQIPLASGSNTPASTSVLKHSSASQKVYTVLYHAEAFESSNDQRPVTKPEATLLGVFGSIGAANTKASQFAEIRLAEEIIDGFDDVRDPYEGLSARESLGYGCHGTRSFAIDGRMRFCVNNFMTGPKTLSVQEHIVESLHRATVPRAAADPRRLPSASTGSPAATTDESSQGDKQIYAVLYHAVGTLQAYLPGIALLAEEPEATTVGIYDSLGAANSKASRIANEHTPSYQRFEDVDDPEETLVPEKLDATACTRSYATDGRVRFCLNTYSNGSKTVAVTKHLLRADAPNRSSHLPRYEFAVLHRLIREEEPSSEMIENFSFEETGVYQSLEEANKVALDLSVHHHAGVTREPDRWSRHALSLWPCPDEADVRISSRGRNGEMRYVFWQLDRVQPSQSSCAWYVVERRRLL
ncbi:hypothetical protein LTR17_000143 [Elasticomyces elasticus]|nr:hypothetical protein LTR17_000143 [Elasticomyces elasticus]